MSVKDYYLAHFDEMPLEKRRHFATRMKYWFNDRQFDDFLSANEPSHNIEEVLSNNDYSGVNNHERRRHFFEKYQNIYGIEASLFRLNHLLIEYDVDLRDDFLRLLPKEKLYEVCDKLISDKNALDTLTTYAVNTICLTENLFPRNKDIYRVLANHYSSSIQKADYIYAYTHIILCMSNFYTKKISGDDWKLASRLLAICGQIIESYYDEISIDAKLEYLVCCMINRDHSNHRPLFFYDKIVAECEEALTNSPFVVDKRKSDKLNAFDRAEHRNALYIMAGLDH